MRLRLSIVDDDTARRLRLIAALSAAYELVVPSPGDDPLKVARASRPDIVLIASGGGARAGALRLCRVLKTDVRAVPWVGLYAREGEEFPSEAAFVAALADGFCLVGAEADPVTRLAAALAAGERPRPAPWPVARTPRWKRVLDRLGGTGR